MVELERTRDPVRAHALQAALKDAGIESFIFDQAAGGLWPGAIPVRLMVDAEDEAQAKRVLKELGWEASKIP